MPLSLGPPGRKQKSWPCKHLPPSLDPSRACVTGLVLSRNKECWPSKLALEIRISAQLPARDVRHDQVLLLRHSNPGHFPEWAEVHDVCARSCISCMPAWCETPQLTIVLLLGMPPLWWWLSCICGSAARLRAVGRPLGEDKMACCSRLSRGLWKIFTGSAFQRPSQGSSAQVVFQAGLSWILVAIRRLPRSCA